MADTKISVLPAGTTPAGTEKIPAVQGAATVSLTAAQIAALYPGGTLSIALNEAPAVTIASSTTPAIGAAVGNSILLTGTVTVTGFDTIAAGAFRRVRFAGILTLTYNATSLVLPTAASITTAANDVGEFLSLGSGNWFCTSYTRASGAALVGSGFTSPLTTKGDLHGFTTVDARLAVGSNGNVLTADSTAAAGVSWQASAGGSGDDTLTWLSFP